MASYAAHSKSRCLVAHAGDDAHHGFLVGTANLHGDNEVRVCVCSGVCKKVPPVPGRPRPPTLRINLTPTLHPPPFQIRLLRYYEEDDELECVAVYGHKH